MKRKHGYSFSIFLLCILCRFTISSPVSRASRMIREVYPDDQEPTIQNQEESGNQAKVLDLEKLKEASLVDTITNRVNTITLTDGLVCIVGDVVYGLGEAVPSEQPCLKCSCAAPAVTCETVTCQQQPGCRAIHRPNKCCPDYLCECQHEGKTYANGERLPSPLGSECKVCYCRGGEVQCAEVGCYTRDDCEPSYVPGQCCPKYDHCPPKEPLSDRIQYTTEAPLVSKIERDFPTTWALTGTPDIYNSTTQIFSNEGSGDDSTEYTPTINSLGVNTNEVKQEISTPVIFSIKEIESRKKNEAKTDQNVIKISKGTQTEIERPKITIQEVIPQRTVYQITSTPKDSTTLKSPIKIIEDSSNELIDSQSYASEKTEVYDHPPPVLRIGDQLLFFKQGQLVPEKDASTPSPVITLIGAEGLQIGVGSEEIIEHELLPTNNEKKPDESLQDISVNAEESVTGSPIDASSEEYISVPEESKIVEITSTEAPKDRTTVNNLEEANIPEEQNIIKVFMPMKRDQEAHLHKPEVSTEFPEHKTELPKTSPVTEFIPEENPYYPALPEDIITREDHEHHEKHHTETTTLTKGIEPTTKSIEQTTESKKLQEKTLKELKNEGKLDELMHNDGPVSEESASESKEDVMEEKKHVEVTSKSQEETTEAISAETKKDIHLEDPEVVSSEENSSEEQKDQPQNDEEITKILPNVSPSLNKTHTSTEKPLDWLKNEEKQKEVKLIPALMNEKAALPREILDMAHETDTTDEEGVVINKKTIIEKDVENVTTAEESISTTTEELLVIGLGENSTQKQEMTTTGSVEFLERKKKDKTEVIKEEVEMTTPEREDIEVTEIKGAIIDPDTSVTKLTTELDKSKETLETSEESSRETTTAKDQNTNLMAGDDANIEVTKDSAQIDTAELVETVPGFEESTDKNEKISSEESSEENTSSTRPKDDVEVISTDKPQEELKKDTEKLKKETSIILKSNKGEKMDEKHKRDVVKKVLKDTFENPTDNIRTELEEDAPTKVLEEIQHEHNVADKRAKEVDSLEVKKEKKISELSSNESETEKVISVEAENFDPEVKIEDDFGDNPTKIQKTDIKATEVIQRIGDIKKLRESAENLDTSLIGIFRDFFSKSQLRYASNEEKV